MDDKFYMERALKLAQNGWGMTRPNPLVGAVIVKEGRIIGEGCHEIFGGPHAEINAIRNCCENTEGATIYVNLEPCSHYGKTPPCSLELIRRKFSRVVVAMEDPNPKVAGNGIRMLRESGIKVDVGLMKEEARRLNDIFIKYITKKTPFILLKYAMSLDGKTATHTGDSKWISGEESREYVHLLRSRYSSILVGVNTIIKDNPELTARSKTVKASNPLRIVLDSEGSIPQNSKILDINEEKKTIIAVTQKADNKKVDFYRSKGAEVIVTESSDGRIDLHQLIEELSRIGIDSVLVEGGGTTAAAFLEQGLVDKVTAFIAPIIVGGKEAITPVEGTGAKSISEALRLKQSKLRTMGQDLVIEGYINVPWREEE